jgi:hypothetical protein
MWLPFPSPYSPLHLPHHYYIFSRLLFLIFLFPLLHLHSSLSYPFSLPFQSPFALFLLLSIQSSITLLSASGRRT